MRNTFFIILGLAIILTSFFLFFGRTPVEKNKTKIIKIGEANIEVEIADTWNTRSKGLSNRKNLSEGTGMLFVFGSPNRYGFWMKNMNFAIDIIWIDEMFRIIKIDRDVLPETFPQTFFPPEPVRYVLELNAGEAEKLGIETDIDVLEFKQ